MGQKKRVRRLKKKTLEEKWGPKKRVKGEKSPKNGSSNLLEDLA
jgi:hypothetical protein